MNVPDAVADPSEPWTLGRVAAWTARDLAARGIDGARLEAELLVAHAMGLRRIDLYLRHEQPLTDAELAKIRALVVRRRNREPLAYLVGSREFYGRSFVTDTRALIPRPETELVVDEVLKALRDPPREAPRVLDVGTGTGAIAITVALEMPDSLVDATDASADAVALARANAARLGASQVTFHLGRTFDPVAGRVFDVIVSNPPYIPSAECDTLMPEVSRWEPRLALDGGADGLEVLRAIVDGAPAHLAPGGTLVLELGHDQGPAARALAESAGFTGVRVELDHARLDRVLVATRG